MSGKGIPVPPLGMNMSIVITSGNISLYEFHAFSEGDAVGHEIIRNSQN